MQSLEYAEQFACISHVKANAVISHEERRGFSVLAAEFDARMRLFSGKIPRIAQEIIENLSQQPLVAPGGNIRRNIEVDLPFRFAFSQRIGDFARDSAEIDLTL